MPRIIGGVAGSLQLATPPTGTRPTSDRVREALFSALEARDVLAGARVLDLYAGSGAFGLEALSRGATSAVLVDKAPTAVRVLRRNAAAVEGSVGGDARVVGQAVGAFLATAAGPFDLVFADPPYDLADAAVAGDLAALLPRLAPEALVLVERSVRSPVPASPAGLELDRTRTYGDTAVHIFRRVGDQPSEAG